MASLSDVTFLPRLFHAHFMGKKAQAQGGQVVS